MKTQPITDINVIQRERHILEVPRCCPVSKNPLPGSTITISYIPKGIVLEVASLKGYIHRFVGGLRDADNNVTVRSMEDLVVRVAKDASRILGVKVIVYAKLLIAPEQKMQIRTIAYPEIEVSHVNH